ncbi:MAG: YCF48-related protein [Phycisphaerales bacterium]|nr:YCF48-related protein [Phycisphaerales bacterium]
MKIIKILFIAFLTISCTKQVKKTTNNNLNVGNLFAVGTNATILNSSDSGNTWQLLPNPLSPNAILTGIGFSNNVNGAITSQGNILSTFNSGSTWMKSTNLPDSFSDMSMADITFIDPLKGFTAGVYDSGKLPISVPVILKTIDGGNSWTRASIPYLTSPQQGEFISVSFANNMVGVVMGNFYQGMGGQSYIYELKTTDGGNTWKQVSTTATGILNKVLFINNSTAFALLGGGVIIKTTDTANTWVSQTIANFTINGIAFMNQDSGVVVGYDGEILRTTDKGNTWRAPNSPKTTFSNLRAVSAYPNGIFIAVGEDNRAGNVGATILKSNDAGYTWKNISNIPIQTKVDLLKVYIN